jgi:hypothetical protein
VIFTPQLLLLRAVCRRLLECRITSVGIGRLLVTCDWTATPTRSGAMAVVTGQSATPAWHGPVGHDIAPFLTYRPDREGD